MSGGCPSGEDELLAAARRATGFAPGDELPAVGAAVYAVVTCPECRHLRTHDRAAQNCVACRGVGFVRFDVERAPVFEPRARS